MKYTLFKNHRVSRLALGTVQLGMDYGIANRDGAPDVAEAMVLLRACSEAGINSFDTSPTYGSSENVLGRYFAEAGRQDCFVISKFKYDADEAVDIDRTWDEVRPIVKQSLEHLGLSKLPLVLYHKGPEQPMDQARTIVPVLLDRLKNEGLIEHGGISLYYSSEANDLLDDQAFEALQIPLNVLDQIIINNGTLQKLHENGKLIMVRSVFLQGLFFMNPQHLTGKLEMAVPYLWRIGQLAAQYDLTIAELVFGFIRDLPWVDSLVVGAENRGQAEANLRLMTAPAIVPELRAELRALSADAPLELITPALWN